MRTILLAAPLLIAMLAGCTAGDERPSAREVRLEDDRFEPLSLSVQDGDGVRFRNVGERDHTITIRSAQDDGDGGPVDIGGGNVDYDEVVGPNDETSYTFSEPGEYDVWCRFHGDPGSGMHMTVTVQ